MRYLDAVFISVARMFGREPPVTTGDCEGEWPWALMECMSFFVFTFKPTITVSLLSYVELIEGLLGTSYVNCLIRV